MSFEDLLTGEFSRRFFLKKVVQGTGGLVVASAVPPTLIASEDVDFSKLKHFLNIKQRHYFLGSSKEMPFTELVEERTATPKPGIDYSMNAADYFKTQAANFSEQNLHDITQKFTIEVPDNSKNAIADDSPFKEEFSDLKTDPNAITEAYILIHYEDPKFQLASFKLMMRPKGMKGYNTVNAAKPEKFRDIHRNIYKIVARGDGKGATLKPSSMPGELMHASRIVKDIGYNPRYPKNILITLPPSGLELQEIILELGNKDSLHHKDTGLTTAFLIRTRDMMKRTQYEYRMIEPHKRAQCPSFRDKLYNNRR